MMVLMDQQQSDEKSPAHGRIPVDRRPAWQGMDTVFFS